MSFPADFYTGPTGPARPTGLVQPFLEAGQCYCGQPGKYAVKKGRDGYPHTARCERHKPPEVAQWQLLALYVMQRGRRKRLGLHQEASVGMYRTSPVW